MAPVWHHHGVSTRPQWCGHAVIAPAEHSRKVLRLPIAQVRESSGHFVLWAGREARAGEDVAANRAAFDQWFVDMQTRERHPELKTPQAWFLTRLLVDRASATASRPSSTAGPDKPSTGTHQLRDAAVALIA
jgi:hypothetical protein